MKLYVLSRRHSERGGLCDVHKSYVGKKRVVAKVLIKSDDERVVAVLGICNACARGIGAAAGESVQP